MTDEERAQLEDFARLKRALVQLLELPCGFGHQVAAALRTAGGTEAAIVHQLPFIVAYLTEERIAEIKKGGA